MLKVFFKTTLLVGGLFLFTPASAQSSNPLAEGWAKFVNNDYEGALADFENASSTGGNPDAFLGQYYAHSAMYNSDKSFQALRSYVETSEDPTVALQALWSFQFGNKSEEMEEFLESIIEKYQGTTRANARMALATFYRSTHELGDAEDLFDEIGTVDIWSALGEFENISESGYDKDFGALANPDFDASFINKVGASVSWFEIKGPRHDKWVNMEYFFGASNSIVYAQNFTTSPDERDVQFRIGVSGSLKFWLNDELIFSESEERNNGLDSYIFTGTLNQGVNRILIQLGESEAGACNFLLRITDETGESFEDLEYSATKNGNYRANPNAQSKVIEDRVIAELKAQIEADASNPLPYLLLNDYYQLKDNTNEAKRLLKVAEELYPSSMYIRVEQLLANVRDGNSTRVSTLIEEIKIKAPTNILGLNLRFSEAMDIEDHEEAEAILATLKEQQGMSANVYNKTIELLQAQDKTEEWLELAAEAYEEYPDDYDFVSLMFAIEKEINSNKSRAGRILDNYIDDNYDPSAMREMASFYFDYQDLAYINRGLDIFEELIENEPAAVGYYSILARINFLLRRYGTAEEYRQEALQIAPYVGSYYANLAEAYQQAEREEDAIEAYTKAIELDPYDYDSRHSLRELQGLGSIYDQFEEVDVYDLMENSPGEEDYPEDNAVILALHTQRVFYEGGGNEEKITLLVKVLNLSGVDSWKEYNIPVMNNQSGTIEKTEVIKANGSRVPAETSGARVVFEDLEPGDAIHVTYRLESHYSGKLANHLWGSEFFQFYIPSLSTRLEILFPRFSETPLKTKMINGEIVYSVDTMETNFLYRWEALNQDAIQYESGMPPLGDVGPTLHYSTIEDWNFISDWYTDLASAKAKTDYEVEIVLQEIFPNGHSGMSDYDKAKSIHDYIVKNIRYRSVSFLQSGLIPQRASTTLTAKQGDCKDVSVLFSTLCREVGLKSDLVLVNTRNQGQHEMELPSINFNHCIAAVDLGEFENPFYVELTTDKLAFATRTKDIDGAFALRIPLHSDASVEAGILQSEEGGSTNSYREAEMTFDGGKVAIERRSIKTGILAASMRNTYRDEGPDRQEQYMQDAVADTYPGTKLTSLEFVSGLGDNSDSLVYNYSVEAEDVMTSISNLEIFSIPFADKFESAPSYISMEERNYPIELWEYFSGSSYHEELIINIPQGKRLSEVPENVVLETEDFSYSCTYVKRGNVLTITRDFAILDANVAPEDYEAFKAAMEKVVKSDTQKLAFQ